MVWRDGTYFSGFHAPRGSVQTNADRDVTPRPTFPCRSDGTYKCSILRTLLACAAQSRHAALMLGTGCSRSRLIAKLRRHARARGLLPFSRTAPILVIGHVAHIVQTVLDAPMAPVERQ